MLAFQRPRWLVNRFATAFFSIALLLPLLQQKGCEPKSQQPAPGTAEFDPVTAERDVRRQIENLRVTLESKQARSVMREIDTSGMEGALSFEDQLTRFFEATTELRLHFRTANVQVRPAEGTRSPARAIAQVDAEMIYALKAAPTQSQRKAGQLTLELVLTTQGWRYVRIDPASFFAP